MRKRPVTRPVVAAAAAVALLLLCAGVYRVSAADDDGAITTTLHPGWNLVGWIHEEIGASDVFAQVDELELIHDGDEHLVRRSAPDDPAALQSLQPGRGYWFHINSERPIDWSRPAEPSTRRFHLEPGEQLVAWAGPSDRSISDVLLGLRDQVTIAWRWLAADQRFVPWSPNPDLPALNIPAIDRGEAVRINLVEGAEWLHPTGNLPELRFAGGLHHRLPDNLRDVIEADLRFVVEQFVAKFKFEIPAERLIIRVPTTPEALQRQQDNANAASTAWAYSPERPGGTSEIVMSSGRWSDDDEPGCAVVSNACSTLSHEYFHVLQHELAGRAREQVPGWLLEGTAMWAHYAVFDKPEPGFEEAQVGTDELDLATRADRYDYAHSVGFAAVAILVNSAGSGSIVDVWQSLGQSAKAEQHWTAGFARAFGVSYPAFLTEFAERRKPLFGTISGRLHASDGQPLPPMSVLALGRVPAEDGSVSWTTYRSEVDNDGAFELTVLRRGIGTSEAVRYALSLSHSDSTCRTGVNPDGTFTFAATASEREGLVVPPPGQPALTLNVQVPASFCRDRLVLQLAGAYGTSGEFQVRFCPTDDGPGFCVQAERFSGGRFATFVPFEGDYRMHVTDRKGKCHTFVGVDGRSRHSGQISGFPSAESSSLVRVRLDSESDLCEEDSLAR